jgi:hypothetical protein
MDRSQINNLNPDLIVVSKLVVNIMIYYTYPMHSHLN